MTLAAVTSVSGYGVPFPCGMTPLEVNLYRYCDTAISSRGNFVTESMIEIMARRRDEGGRIVRRRDAGTDSLEHCEIVVGEVDRIRECRD